MRSDLESIIIRAGGLQTNTTGTLGQDLPQEVSEHLSNIEFAADEASKDLEKRELEQGRAKLIRSEFYCDVEEIKSWVRTSVAKVVDSEISLPVLKRNINEIQLELRSSGERLDMLREKGKTIVEKTNSHKEKVIIPLTMKNLSEQIAQTKQLIQDKIESI